MKKMKKIVSLLLALVMTFAMASTVFATQTPVTGGSGTYDLTVDAVDGHTYKVYQLLAGEVASSEDILSNAVPGANAGSHTVQDILNAVTDENGDLLNGIALSNAAAALIAEGEVPVAVLNSTSKSVKVPGGYYVITDEYVGDPNGTTLSATMVQLLGDLTIKPKAADAPETPDKTVDKKTVSIGDTVTYTLKGTIPSMNGFEHYRYVLVDTLTVGLTANVKEGQEFTAKLVAPEGATETLPEKTVTFKVTSITDSEATTGDKVGGKVMRFALVNAIDYAKYAGYKFEFTYTALVNTDAVIDDKNPNYVYVDHSINPDQEGDKDDFEPDEPRGETPEIKVDVYPTKLVIEKIDADGNVLTGAEFKLEGVSMNVGFVTGQKYVPMAEAPEDYAGEAWYKLVDGAYTTTVPTDTTANKYESTEATYALVSVDEKQYTETQVSAQAFVDKDGKVTFTGLGEGIYTLTEVTTPDGYNTIDPIYIEITFDEETKTFSAKKVADKDGTPIEGTTDEDTNVDLDGYQIVNNKGSLLPSTGGIGTTIFYVVGTILVLGAGILLVTKRRMNAQ